MPSSGRVEEINRRAKAQNEERRAYQEKEAQCVPPSSPSRSVLTQGRRLANGVYRYRTFDNNQ